MECEQIRSLISSNRQLLLYACIGCTGVTIDFIAFLILTQYFLVPYLIANLAAVSLGITNNFFLNAFYNFKVKDRLINRFVRFYSIGLLGLLLSSGLLFLLVNTFSMHQVTAKSATVIIVALLQFYLNRTVTFIKSEYTHGQITHSNSGI